jgi:type IV secretory pathway VirB6-like protein
MNKACGLPAAIRVTPSILLDTIDVAKCMKQFAQTKSPACLAGLTAAGVSISAFLGELAIVHRVASDAYDTTEVCGAQWYKANDNTKTMTTPNVKAQVQTAIEGFMALTDETEKLNKLSLENSKLYREWYYNGIEYEDNASGSADCHDPTTMIASDYNSYPLQKYYLKGLESGNYNCKKYMLKPGQNDPVGNITLTALRRSHFETAYECCKKRSQEYMCISHDNSASFCQVGELCNIKGITYSVKSVDNDRLLCAESYSVCPYNFSVAGGTQVCNYYKDGIWNESNGVWDMITPDDMEDENKKPKSCAGKSEVRNDDCTFNEKAGKCKNYCQFFTHCTKTSSVDFRYNSSLASPYFSEACLNFVGDSKNQTTFDGGIIFGSQRHFSAPIAQCTKETLENLFHDVAGHTKCLRADEYPNADGTCASGNYVFQKGKGVLKDSFFTTLQNKMHFLVKMVLTFSITFYGMNILLGKNNIGDKKDILVYILKIGMVLYFATGDAWQSYFFDGVYGSSAELSQMVFKIKTNEDPKLQDGCQFGMITNADGTEFSSGRLYPKGKQYLAIWDTLDCKIARYLGFGPEASVANIAMLIFAGFLTGPVGIYFAISLMFIGIFLLMLTIRALHIFLSSVISIVLMVFVSPIIIPTALFKKTEHIYKGWLTNLISFCIQPMILFSYIAIVIIVIDATFIGSATFQGQGPLKAISCKTICQNANGSIVDESAGAVDCSAKGQKIIDPMNDSVACLIGVNSFGTVPGMEVIGISIPIIKTLFSSHVKDRILTILRGALVLFFLYKMVDQIPGISSAIIGGASLPSGGGSAAAMLKKIAKMSREVQKRAQGAAKKEGVGSMESAAERSREITSKGKSADSVSDTKGESSIDRGGSTSEIRSGGGASRLER